jgi:polyisoprenoid-binding protein YceI
MSTIEKTQGTGTTTVWGIDTAHTNIDFSVSHMVISEVTGKFKEFEGTVTASNEDFSDAAIEVKISAGSINTENSDRDAHLRSADFFDVDKYPSISFKSIKTEAVKNDRLVVTGELLMRGVTKPVTLDVKFKGKAVNPWGQLIAAFKATATINRKEWGLQWNKTLETGGFLVGEEITLSLNIEVVQR